MSDAAKLKISAGNKGKVRSEETKKKMSEAKKGTTLSKEHKAKIGRGLLGRPVSDETRKKQKASNINKTQKHSRKVMSLNEETGEVLHFNNISQAARIIGTFRRYVKNNKLKGFKFTLI